jgi:hypothetical protein
VDIAKWVIKEPSIANARAYSHRVWALAAIYSLIFLCSLAGEIVLLWNSKLFIALAQRSNVETLTIAFFLVFFLYLMAVSSPGVLGTTRLLFHEATGGKKPFQRRSSDPLAAVALNRCVEIEGMPGAEFRLTVGDDRGVLGELIFDGARLSHETFGRNGSSNLLSFVVGQIRDILGKRGVNVPFDITHWKILDDEETETYLALVKFSQYLSKALQSEALWPTLVLREADREELARRLREVCPALRRESFFPDWEYRAEHKLPIIPEPLGLITLQRSEKRVDPISSMGAVLVVALIALALSSLMVFWPPWVPGT